MNLGDAKTRVSVLLDDLNQTYFTPSQLTAWINSAQKEVQKMLVRAGSGFYIKCLQTPTVINQYNYVLPEDFLQENRLEIIVSGTGINETHSPMSPITMNQQDLVVRTTGVPQVYYFKNKRLVVLPAADATSYLIRLHYSYVAVDLVNESDVIDVPEEYAELVVLYAAYDGHIKDQRDPQILSMKISPYIDALKAMAAQRNVDESRSVKDTGAYAQADWTFF